MLRSRGLGLLLSERRDKLERARLLLIFTPALARVDAFEQLAACLPHIDIVQVRPKPFGETSAVTLARDAYDLTERVWTLVSACEPESRPLLFVNDRVDVAKALAADGVHLGTGDTPPRVARDVLGDDMLIGLSTHGAADIARSHDEPVDMLGFGPVFEAPTKGYGTNAASPRQPVGPEAAWVASESANVPVFPIGGIDTTNVDQLDRVGRAAVGSAVLGSEDSGATARALRAILIDSHGAR